jgi:polysaccharide deacetylase 2 family uncharacterized protein YibQ
MIALPRLSAPVFRIPRLGGLLANHYVGVGAAAALLATAVGGLVMIMGSAHPNPGSVRMSLTDTFAKAPPGWRQTLHRAAGPVTVSRDIVQLTERATLAVIGAPWNRPGPAPTPLPVIVGESLTPAPIAGVSVPGPGGLLPVVAPDGRTPFDAYKRPFLSNGRPRVALVIGGLGLNARLTQQAIETLPGEITLAFVPYADGLQDWINKARAHGHEVLIETPMEPVDFPDNDPGPYTLMAGARPAENVRKLEWVMSRASGYMGLSNYLGSRFLSVDSAYATLATVARGRGLAFVDDGSAARRTGGGVIRASAERVIDDQLAKAAIDGQLLAMESGAAQHGQALGSGFAYPVTLDAVARWARSVDQRGFQLAPASALVRR